MPKLQTKEVFQTKLTHSFVCVCLRNWFDLLNCLSLFLFSTQQQEEIVVSALPFIAIALKYKEEKKRCRTTYACFCLTRLVQSGCFLKREESVRKC